MQLTNDNYYSQEANQAYMSVSQFKDFAGSLAHAGCESNALAKFKGDIPNPVTTPLLVGSYVDSYFEGTLDDFKTDYASYLYKKTGDKGLKAEFLQAEEIIRRLNDDKLFMDYMSGDKQVIMTANLFGIDWKIKMDSYLPDDKIVDLKIVKDMELIWSDDLGYKVDFIHYWGYDIQGAVYQKVVELNTGKKLPFYIACATKEANMDYAIIEIPQMYLDKALKYVEDNLPRVIDVKNGKAAPMPCGRCSFCKSVKKLERTISLEELMPSKYIETFLLDDDVDIEEQVNDIYASAAPVQSTKPVPPVSFGTSNTLDDDNPYA